MTSRHIIATTLLLVFVLAGCRGYEYASSTPDVDVTMQLSVAPNPPQTGEATLVVTLRTLDGEPINDAKINVRGDMNHAGMQPVLREGSTGRDGDYQIPFEWTMGGDWFVVVTAELTDGLIVEEEFDFTVGGDMVMDDMDMATEEMNDMDMDMATEEPADS